jgi:hypothetical protein
MLLISGIVLIALVVALFVYSLPRKGKPAGFVGTPWEPYIAILLISGLGLGVLVTVSGVIPILDY